MKYSSVMNTVQALGLAGALLAGNEMLLAKAKEHPVSEAAPYHSRSSIHSEDLFRLSESLDKKLEKTCMASFDYYMEIGRSIGDSSDAGLISITGLQARSRLRLDMFNGVAHDYFCKSDKRPDMNQMTDVNKYSSYVSALRSHAFDLVRTGKFDYKKYDEDSEKFLLENTDIRDRIGNNEERLYQTMRRVMLDSLERK